MVYILEEQREEDVVGGFKRYAAYLDSVKDAFPPSAFALASSEWYFDPNDHRCPHDAWLEELTIRESSTVKNNEGGTLSITATLLGAYHDGIIRLSYPEVYSYSFQKQSEKTPCRDWLYDEFRLSEKGHLLHEIQWAAGHWLIESSDILFTWHPFEKTKNENKK